MTMEVPISYEIISWILRCGSAPEVLQPASLKSRIVEELEPSLERCRSKGQARKKIVPEKKVPATLS